ncbi:molybdopterin-dependent oxidoreductase [Roseomonas sp. 18066]|uniref:molybdopterin-dependent oxidoreductase n=1 Tax=Roseomonas sp. 18066 TaxID=2681412 RepID=UPI001358B6B8|nr:molybdopterin-dependent oxidoreductase [Roseomonas sp. 18066]
MAVIKPHAAHWGSYDTVVEDGRLTGIRPFARDPNPGALLHSVPDALYSKARIDQPYIRAGWLRGERRGAERGDRDFVPVSWDQAVRFAAEETARVRAESGHPSIMGGSYGWSSAGRFHHAKSQLQRFLGLGGGFTTQVTNYSYGAGMTLMPHVLGTNDVIQGPVTDFASILKHTRLMICIGGLPLKNALVTAGGAGAHEYVPWLKQIAAAGVRFVNISPFRGDAPDFLDAEWVPIRPNTDTALILAMIHTLVVDGLEDRGFLATHCTGWDRLRPYVMGETDGMPKTAAWAAAITEVPEEKIRALAFEAARLPTMLTATWSIQRAEHGEQPWWALVALAAALGGIGKPGEGITFGYGSMNGMGTPRREIPSVSLPATRNAGGLAIPVARVTELLERPGEILQYNGRDITLPDIRIIWWAGGNPFHHHQDLNRLLRAWNRAETIIVQEPFWTAAARHADIVLPATTTLERNDIASSSRDRFVRAMHQAVAPVGQARNDHDMLADMAEHLGFRDRFTEQRDEGAWLRHVYERWRTACRHFDFSPPSFEEFWETGHVEVPPPDEDFVLFEDFARDPANHPLNTPSGKVELFSETIAGFNYEEIGGHPRWTPPTEFLGAPLAARFPLHLLSYQPATRLHGQLDTGRVAAASKIQGREPLLMNPADAAARGLVDGAIIRVFNDRGACLAGLQVTDGIRPGVVAMATGAWWDPEHRPGRLDVHGNPNVLTHDHGTSRLGQGSAAQSCLVEIALFAEALPPVTVHDAPRPVAELSA